MRKLLNIVLSLVCLTLVISTIYSKGVGSNPKAWNPKYPPVYTPVYSNYSPKEVYTPGYFPKVGGKGGVGGKPGSPYYCKSDRSIYAICPAVISPVCGFWDPRTIQCIRAPCVGDYNNLCEACRDDKVFKVVPGRCHYY